MIHITWIPQLNTMNLEDSNGPRFFAAGVFSPLSLCLLLFVFPESLSSPAIFHPARKAPSCFERGTFGPAKAAHLKKSCSQASRFKGNHRNKKEPVQPVFALIMFGIHVGTLHCTVSYEFIGVAGGRTLGTWARHPSANSGTGEG